MAVATYIHDLLFRYECVVLPGFGAFIIQQYPASLDRSTGQFFPPKKTVSFNGQLVRNDGLLANHLVEVERIPYAKAVEKIEQFVEDLFAVLKSNGVVELDAIGKFTAGEANTVQFEPISGKNFLKEAFGLAQIPAGAVVREKEMEPALQPAERSSESTSSPWLKYAAVGLLAVGISSFAGMNVYKYQINEHNLAEQQKAANQLENQIQKATFAIESPLPAITLEVSKESGNYHLVAGAYRLKENAEKRVKQLKDQGYNARKIPANKFGLHQVLYSSHENRSEALKALWQVKNSNPAAWLLVQEL